MSSGSQDNADDHAEIRIESLVVLQSHELVSAKSVNPHQGENRFTIIITNANGIILRIICTIDSSLQFH